MTLRKALQSLVMSMVGLPDLDGSGIGCSGGLFTQMDGHNIGNGSLKSKVFGWHDGSQMTINTTTRFVWNNGHGIVIDFTQDPGKGQRRRESFPSMRVSSGWGHRKVVFESVMMTLMRQFCAR